MNEADAAERADIDLLFGNQAPVSKSDAPATKGCSYDGDCPMCRCGESDLMMLNVYKDHWLVCRKHRTRWLVGSNLYSSWEHETEADWERHRKELDEYTEVEPRFCQRCFGKRWHPTPVTECLWKMK